MKMNRRDVKPYTTSISGSESPFNKSEVGNALRKLKTIFKNNLERNLNHSELNLERGSEYSFL